MDGGSEGKRLDGKRPQARQAAFDWQADCVSLGGSTVAVRKALKKCLASDLNELTMKKRESIDKTNGYAAVRLNAVKHGILSRETVLPHESRQDFETLLYELQDEYLPNGQTERTLVEELATILWRKRRVLAAEGAQINSGIACAMANSLRLVNTATPFLPRITGNELSDDESLPVREILAPDTDGLGRRRKDLQVMYESVAKVQLLTQGGRGAARRALETLPEAVSALWFEKERYGETIYQVDRFLEMRCCRILPKKKGCSITLTCCAVKLSEAPFRVCLLSQSRAMRRIWTVNSSERSPCSSS